MPLLIPELPKIECTNDLVGRIYVDESIAVTDPQLLDKDKVDFEKVVFKSQLPDNVVILTQDMDGVAITGALKSGLQPIIIDANNKIVKSAF